jgi:WD40 repeat protein
VATIDDDTTCRFVFAPKGDILFTLSKSGRVGAWAALTGKQLYSFAAHNDGDERRIFGLAINGNGKLLATFAEESYGSEDAVVKLWDVPTKKELASWRHKDGFSAVAFAADGFNLVCGRDNGEVIFQEGKRGGSARVLRDRGATVSPSVRSIHVAPAISRMVVGCTDTVELWRVPKQPPANKEVQ